MVTHDSSIARRAQRVGQMRDGRLLIRQDTGGAHQAVVPAGPANPADPGPQPTDPWQPS